MEEVRIEAFEVLRKLKGSEDLFAHPKPILEMIQNKLLLVARNSFQNQTSPDGVPWVPLSKRYAKWKAKHFPAKTHMLQRGGQLIRSLRAGIEVEKRTAYATEGPLVYAAVHQFGFNGTVTVPAHARKLSARGRGKKRTTGRTTQVRAHSRRMRIPARPTLGFPLYAQQETAEDIKELIMAPYEEK